MIKVIVPSALVVPVEQQNIGKLPAVIYPADKKIMLDFIIDQYRNVANEIIISLFEEAGKVIEIINNYNENIKVCELDSLKDIGYSVYCALMSSEINDKDSIIINYGDVISLDPVPEEIEDTIIYSDEKPSSNWAYFSFENGKINNIIYNPKDISIIDSSKMFMGVFYIKEAIDFFRVLKDEIHNDGELDSFFRALIKYNDRHKFRFWKTEKWFDIGHSEKYFDAQIEVKARAFNHISIDKDRGTLTKTSDDSEKLVGEIKWYLKIPSDIQYSLPRVYSFCTDYNHPSITMEYYPYHTLHELMIYGGLDKTKWERIFERIRFVMSDYGKYTVRDERIKDSLRYMYIDKTLSRIEKLRSNEAFNELWDGYPCINGKKVIGLNTLIKKLPYIIENNLLDVDKFPIIHGDLCFANIMIDPKLNFIKLIDPRGKFGFFDIYGDVRYDVAKILHSFDGKYDYLIKDMFRVEVKGNRISLDIREKKHGFDFMDCFMTQFSDIIYDSNEYSKEKLIEALLFLSMICLHTESTDRQLAMYSKGMLLLEESGYLNMED